MNSLCLIAALFLVCVHHVNGAERRGLPRSHSAPELSNPLPVFIEIPSAENRAFNNLFTLFSKAPEGSIRASAAFFSDKEGKIINSQHDLEIKLKAYEEGQSEVSESSGSNTDDDVDPKDSAPHRKHPGQENSNKPAGPPLLQVATSASPASSAMMAKK